jgi:NTE family protein
MATRATRVAKTCERAEFITCKNRNAKLRLMKNAELTPIPSTDDSQRSDPAVALVLMGGGARTAYQAGVLQALGELLGEQNPQQKAPFQIMVGTSAGALNASFLAARAQKGLSAFDDLANFWAGLHSDQVFRLKVPKWLQVSRVATSWYLARQVKQRGAFLDNMPMTNTLHQTVSLAAIDEALAQGALKALAITAYSYTSGVHWTFCHTHDDHEQKVWNRPGRRAEFQPITMEHLMASSAIPLIFSAKPLWVDGGSEHFGDGSIKQTSPLSPAVQLGAQKIFVIGVGQAERTDPDGQAAAELPIAKHSRKRGAPGVAGVLGHALSAVFYDTMRGDVEQAQQINAIMKSVPPEAAAQMPYRQVDVMQIQPSESIDEIARKSAHAMPSEVRGVLAALAGKRAAASAGASLASYLLFESEFTRPLIELGRRDAFAKKDALLAFFQGS